MKRKNIVSFAGFSALSALTFAAVMMLSASPAHAQAALYSTLGPGDSGAQVSALQRFLATDSAVYPEGLVTGYYGSLTTAAVQRFQCNNNIVCSGDPVSTGYGRVGPRTLAVINGGTVSTGGGLDVYAPTMSQETVSTSTPGTAVITWTTNEPARSRVMYATTYPFLYANAPSFSAPSVSTTPQVTLTGLASHTTYFYVRESVDAAGNVMWTTARTFTTN